MGTPMSSSCEVLAISCNVDGVPCSGYSSLRLSSFLAPRPFVFEVTFDAYLFRLFILPVAARRLRLAAGVARGLRRNVPLLGSVSPPPGTCKYAATFSQSKCGHACVRGSIPQELAT